QHDVIFDALYGLKLNDFQSRKQIDKALAKTIPASSTRQFLIKNLTRNDAGSFTWRINLDVLYNNYDALNKTIEPSLPFTKPALFIKGGNSHYVLEDDAEEIKRLFPHSTVATIQDAGHWVHADAPDEFEQVVLDFLLKQS
ncbi:MAG: alpha/beta hydrolase, partial [Ignavibacteriales bacterium]|nr:alpha/beta hydrolase [Ignavibacteriales bacterium]